MMGSESNFELNESDEELMVLLGNGFPGEQNGRKK
jgi:hypothetical protein